MSIVSTVRTVRKTWLLLVLRVQVIMGLSCHIGIIKSPTAAVFTAVVLLVLTLVVHSLTAASRKLDAIFDEELTTRTDEPRWRATPHDR